MKENPGAELPGISKADQQIRSVAVLLKRDLKFKEAASDAFIAAPGKPHVSV
jgi:hypothetical protein